MIVLLEGVAPNQQTVVKVTVGKSQTLYSSVSRRGKDKNNGLLSIGAVNIDIPQHPVALHGVMTRSSKQLSTTLQVSFSRNFQSIIIITCIDKIIKMNNPFLRN